MNYDCVLKIGNAGNFDRRLFNSFLNETGYSPEDPETFEPYDAGTLPDKNNSISLIQSKANFNNEWKTLEKYVGFSTIKGADYTDTGSTITDFFIDLNVKFSESNIKRLYQIIKIYATQKLQKLTENKPYTKVEFKEALKNYINEVNLIGNNMVTEISTYLNKNLPDKKVKNNSNSTVEGETTKLSLYSVFQTLNDKWI